MARRITCIASHDSNSYMLVGSIDGTVKILNIINATVHEFFAHSRPVVSIAVIPRGPLFITVGQDNTLRLFNLKYFREICCIRLKEKPIEMGMVGEENIYIRTRSGTELWATNQFNVNVATMSSNITHLQYVKAAGNNFSKIFARTDDNVSRLLSPITGRTITANLTPVENEVVLDVAYYSQTNRMYVLLETGDIWVFRTDQNPCTIVDVWNSAEARIELCSKLLICQGKFAEEDAKLCPSQLNSFGFLLAGTKNGHIILFGRGGFVIDRYQLHMGEITEMHYQEQDHLLVTSGLDTRIRISKIEPFHSNLIQIQIDIITNYIPQAIAVLGNIICVAADDASIQMFIVNIKKQGSLLFDILTI
jgi:WD40 repeat protein